MTNTCVLSEEDNNIGLCNLSGFPYEVLHRTVSNETEDYLNGESMASGLHHPAESPRR
jgi:hypothetical protein